MRNELLVGVALVAAAAALASVRTGVEAWGRGDFRKAVEQWRGPATAGDADAQFNLGQAYKLGRGVPLDPALAESWFRKAALQGHAQAGDNYALALFQAGRKAEALPWLDKAVARGEPRCQLVLGTMLFNGEQTPRDYPRAFALLTRASAAGLPTAAETLARVDQYLTPADRERGTRLARLYAADAALRPAPGPEIAPAATPVQAPAQPRFVEIKADAAAPQAMRAGAGGWAIQLGAFRDRARADALWAEMGPKFPGAQDFYVEAGGLIRVQASGYATKAAAQTACKRARIPCILVAP